MAMKRYGGASALAIQSREEARERYWSEYEMETHSCYACGSDSKPLEVHHRDGDPLNNHLINLVALCYRCHKAVHKRRQTRDALDRWRQSIDDLTLNV